MRRTWRSHRSTKFRCPCGVASGSMPLSPAAGVPRITASSGNSPTLAKTLRRLSIALWKNGQTMRQPPPAMCHTAAPRQGARSQMDRASARTASIRLTIAAGTSQSVNQSNPKVSFDTADARDSPAYTHTHSPSPLSSFSQLSLSLPFLSFIHKRL